MVCVISGDYKISRGTQLHEIRFNLHVPRIVEIGLKMWKFRKKMKGFDSCFFSTIHVNLRNKKSRLVFILLNLFNI